MKKSKQDRISALAELTVPYRSAQEELLNQRLRDFETSVESSIGTIKSRFEDLDIKHRYVFLQHMDEVITDFIQRFSYDPRIARKIRKDAGLNQGRLAEILGEGTRAEVSNMERVAEFPSHNPVKGSIRVAYYTWLKDHGYNPFGI